MLSRIGEPDRAASQPLRRRIDQHLPRFRGRLHPGGGVHRVSGHHALTDRAQRDGDLAGDHPGASCQPRYASLHAELGHYGD
jgi:hypothetical protein